jgi:hypothetical protein
MELLRASQKPAVGHNLRFDVAYVLAGFVQKPLPKTWSGFKALVGKWFPGESFGGARGIMRVFVDTGSWGGVKGEG